MGNEVFLHAKTTPPPVGEAAVDVLARRLAAEAPELAALEAN